VKIKIEIVCVWILKAMLVDTQKVRKMIFTEILYTFIHIFFLYECYC